jgi:hypothetical protein
VGKERKCQRGFLVRSFLTTKTHAEYLSAGKRTCVDGNVTPTICNIAVKSSLLLDRSTSKSFAFRLGRTG